MSLDTNSNSLLDQILSECKHPEKVRFKNLKSVSFMIQEVVQGGTAKLQFITDFDFTLSKAHAKDKKCFPSADIIRQSPLMSDEFKARARLRYDKLLPVEIDTGLTIEEKIPTVIASFKEAFDDLVESRKINKTSLAQMITNAGDSCSFELRDFCHETLKLLHDAQVPTLIFSAGFGDVIQGILQKYALHYPNIHIIGNFMEFDEDGQLIGFKDPLIHTFNKNEDAVPQNCRYFDELSHRANVILLGDSIGDADMAQGVHGAGTVLKIGFLNEVNEVQLETFLKHFDVVLLDDQTTDFVNCLLKKILSAQVVL